MPNLSKLLLQRLLYISLLTAVLAAAGCDGVYDEPFGSLSAGDGVPAYVSEDRATILVLTNAARADSGVAPLVYDEAISAVAQAHAEDMAARQYFSHTNPDGQSPFDRLNAAGIQYSTAGENIAWYPSAQSAVNGWINSSGHYANMMRASFGEIGIGVYNPNPGQVGNTYYVQLFTN